MFKQAWLEGFPDGALRIGKNVMLLEKDDDVVYLVGGDNYFSHKKGDPQGRRFALASLMDNGHVRASELTDAPLCIPRRTLMHWKAQCRERGPSSFYVQPPRVKPQVMTAPMNAQCAQLLGAGLHPSEVARRVGINESTLRKAIARQALASPTPPQPEDTVAAQSNTTSQSKSERSRSDAQAADGMGTACTRADERVAAAMGLVGAATTRFEAAHDVQMAGLLAGLPALCANGLLSGLGRHLSLPKGFYSALHIVLVLGFMALGRIRRPEGLRHIAPGELGKVIGLDRVPEVRTLREKVGLLARSANPQAWMRELSKSWMDNDPEQAGYLYVDGHVRVYHGELAQLPRRFVSRQRLCLHGTTDYWVNDALGRPFFVVSKALTDGLADALLTDIVPELVRSVPQQPTPQELEADPFLHRFVIVFDREGANHRLLSELWQKHRIGALTYRKNVTERWAISEFKEYDVGLPGGEVTRMQLAKRAAQIRAGDQQMPVSEVRRLTPTGHQTAVITSAQHLGTIEIAAHMFTRWCQENYFAYMMKHYDIDGLIEYGAQDIPGTPQVTNPAWRELDHAVKRALQMQRKRQAALTVATLNDGVDIQKKADCLQALEVVDAELQELRAKRKAVPRKVAIDSVPQEQRPTQLRPLNKMLMDAIKMIAYRSETAMVGLLRRHLKNPDEARALIRELFVSSADIEPDDVANTLTIRVHRMANPMHDRAISALLKELTESEFVHPETGTKMTFTLV